jgi:prepilin-type N-terminal cleavage/methylation domain-containing protein
MPHGDARRAGPAHRSPPARRPRAAQRPHPHPHPHAQRGFTLLWLLAVVAVAGIGLSIIGPAWAQRVQRQREAALLRIGFTYVQAIEHYVRVSPGGQPSWPRDVSDLLEDPRFPGAVVRHLRSAYDDPLRPGQPLRLLRGPAGELRGVSSDSLDAPLRQTPWTDGRHQLPVVTHYSDWQFLASPSS